MQTPASPPPLKGDSALRHLANIYSEEKVSLFLSREDNHEIITLPNEVNMSFLLVYIA